MLIGLRIVLMLGLMAVVVPLVAYAVTRNARFYALALKAGKVTLILVGAILALYLIERFLLVL